MNRKFFITAACFFAVLFSSCAMKLPSVTTPDISLIPDGTYRGSYDGGIVFASVEVVVLSGRIESVSILEHRCGTGKPAEAIVESVVKEQSLDVDAVSGSTYSSAVILKAIENALSSAISGG